MTVVPFVSQEPLNEINLWLDALRAAFPTSIKIMPVDELQSTEDVRVALVANPDPADIETLTDLVWVQSLWAGVEKLISEPALDPIGICRLVDPTLAATMAEAVLAWALYLHRDMPSYRSQQRKRLWAQLPYRPSSECRVGILGLGKLGMAAATRLTDNGFNVLGWSKRPKESASISCYHGEEGLSELVQQADILVNLLPLTSDTHSLINGSLMDQLPAGASLINFGRGPTLDTDALVRRLDNGALKHAVLDVFDEEPLSQDSPLWRHPSITILPHISAPTTMTTAAKIAADNIVRYLDTGALPELIDRSQGY